MGYIDNSNINVDHLVQDGLHLNEVGRKILANYLINSWNVYILCNKKACKLKEITDNNLDVADIRNYYFKSAVASHPSIILIKGKT